MNRLTRWEDDRVRALCRAAWDALLKKGENRLWVSRDDFLLLLKAGGRLVSMPHQVTVTPKGKKKKPKQMWEAELVYPDDPDHAHAFFHQERRYFYVPRPRPKRRFPWGP